MKTIALSIRAPLTREDLPGLYVRVCALLEATAPQRVVCDVSGIGADAVALDALARLQLAARRHGCRIELRGAAEDLLGLMRLAGLETVF